MIQCRRYAYLEESVYRPGKNPTTRSRCLGRTWDEAQARLEQLVGDRRKAKELANQLYLTRTPVTEAEKMAGEVKKLLGRARQEEVRAVLMAAMDALRALQEADSGDNHQDAPGGPSSGGR